VKFVIRPAAREDILRQYQYYLIEAENERVAALFLSAVQSTIAQVCRQPGIGVPKELRNLKLVGLRSSPVRGFSDIRVYYLVSEQTLQVYLRIERRVKKAVSERESIVVASRYNLGGDLIEPRILCGRCKG
jgi:plasmid stabilization system protein ParE